MKLIAQVGTRPHRRRPPRGHLRVVAVPSLVNLREPAFEFPVVEVADDAWVEHHLVALGVEQQVIDVVAPSARVVLAPLRSRFIPPPRNFAPAVAPAKNGVHQGLGVSLGRMVDVEIDAPIVAENPVHFQQPHTQPTQERSHVVTVDFLGGVDSLPDRWMIPLNLNEPVVVNIVPPAPTVLKLRPRRQTVRRGVEVLVFVERRVGGNQVDGPGVDTPQEVEVIPVEKGAVGDVDFSHA